MASLKLPYMCVVIANHTRHQLKKGTPMLQQNFVFGQKNAKTLLDNTTSLQNDFCLPINAFSDQAIEIILKRPVLCYVPTIGKSRLIESEEEISSMLIKSVHISPPEFLSFLRALPINKLQNTVINVIFLEDNASKIQEHIFNMFFLKSNQKLGAKNGKIDYSKLEMDFLTSLPKHKRVKDYIKSARRYSYAAYLAISSKTFSAEAEK